MKKFFKTLSLMFMIILAVILSACSNTLGSKNNPIKSKQVPIYQGMIVSKYATASIASRSAHNIHEGKFDHNHVYDINNPFGKNNRIEDKVDSLIDVDDTTISSYYASINEDVLITVKLSNPDSFEILSFTLNGVKYQSYQFEYGSDSENLILKVNVGNACGVSDYTIDAIKYVDGTNIKDCLMNGEKTIKVSVKSDIKPTATISNEKIAVDKISFKANIEDENSLIQKSNGSILAVLYDGNTIVSKKTLSLYENEVEFDNLSDEKLYEYAIIASYDDFSNTDQKIYILSKKAFYTKSVLLFNNDNIEITKYSANWDYVWSVDEEKQIIVSQELYLGDNKVADIGNSVFEITNLLSDTTYTLKTTYKNLANENKIIDFSFTTIGLDVPKVEIVNFSQGFDNISFEIEKTDNDSILVFNKYEIWKDTELVKTSTTYVTSISELLTNNEYKLKLYYKYNLNDGTSDKELVVEKEFKTLEKEIPDVNLTNIVPTKSSVSFDLSVVDSDNVGSISKIELIHNNQNPLIVLNNQREIVDLLSDNDYKLKIVYIYNLDDGKGQHDIVIEKEFKTLEKETPIVDFVRDTQALNGTQTFEYVLNNDGKSYTINSFGSSRDEKVILGGYYNNLPITDVKANVFQGCTWIKDVVVLDTIKNIGNEAFINSGINAIYFENSIPCTIGNNLFGNRYPKVFVPNDAFEIYKNINVASWITTTEKYVRTFENGNLDYDDFFNGSSHIIVNTTAIDLKVSQTDKDNTITSLNVELYKNSSKVKDFIVNNGIYSVNGLLSNNAYQIVVTIKYDLCDGNGEQIIKLIKDIVTEKEIPPSIRFTDVEKSYNSISFDLLIEDNNGMGYNITDISIYKRSDDSKIATLTADNCAYIGLNQGTQYYVKVMFNYSLNDGLGVVNDYQIYLFMTNSRSYMGEGIPEADPNDDRWYMISEPIKVYAKLNSNGYVTEMGSSIFISDYTNWVYVDEGYGDKYAHAQSQYISDSLVGSKYEYGEYIGGYNYKYMKGIIVYTGEYPLMW